MNRPNPPRLYLHEWLFGFFLVVTAARLFPAGAPGLGLGFSAMAVAVGAMAAAGNRWTSTGMARARLLLFPVLVNVTYALLGSVVLQLNTAARDAALMHADRTLFGNTPSELTANWNLPFLTEILSGCYLLFFPAVLAAFAVAVRRPLPRSVRLFDGLIGIYALGFLGYTMIPASGPHLAYPELFSGPLEGGALTQFNASLVQAGSNRVDAFPSLHTAITIFLMGWLWPRHRRLFFALLAPAAGLCAATIYLRYHYAIDVAAGIVLAAAGLWLARDPVKPHDPHTPL